MLYALATPGSAFKPSINKPSITWRLKKFKQHNTESRNSSAALSCVSQNSLNGLRF
ncbi:hypothetical protein METSCH_C05830 [Metschnikowia aff. pulcherrima]|uniref:Uncharacterized protein n=1 Tax=Metschnikowia aff. pulcherrima TaxID=2163413 RepID=A0A4P6XNV7_9ASCO|nr:hypothetical protein METSCH_C05830 [Metschnikowia aff. pulcherrima]